jgi:hypothetical protein
MKSQHTRLFEQLVAERRQAHVEAMIAGSTDVAGLIGRIRGLDEALKLSEEADFKLSGDEPE